MLSKYRLPTILAVLILGAGVVTGIVVVGQRQTALFPRAAAEFTPKQVKITNVADKGFSVSWLTDEETGGFIKLGTKTNKLQETFGDDRDQKTGKVEERLTHHITVKELKPKTAYFFKLGSGPKKTLYENQDEPYQVTTGPTLTTQPAADTAYGTVMTETGDPAKGAMVYITLPGVTPLSTLVQDSGNWVVSLATARSSDLSSYASYDPQTQVMEILVETGRGKGTAQVTTGNDSPVPTITLGKSFDFTVAEEQEASEAAVMNLEEAEGLGGIEATPTSQFSLAALPGLGASEEEKIAIVNPGREGEVLTTTQPVFLGTGPEGGTVTVTVESTSTLSSQVEVDEEGIWEWTPTTSLAPGNHKVTVSFVDTQGKRQSISRNFVIAAASSGVGGLPALTASPSATATSSPEPRVSLPSTAGGVPTPGTLTPTLGLFILGMMFLGGGLLWQLKKGFIDE